MSKEEILRKLLEVKKICLTDRKEESLPYLCVNFRNVFGDYMEEVFNFNIAKRICRELHLTKPIDERRIFIGWWRCSDYKTRLAIVNRLIKETKESI